MSERSTVTGATWAQIGTGPAVVQLISTGTPIMVVDQTASPTGNDGEILTDAGESLTFTRAQAIWALVVNPTASAVVAVQPG